MLFLLVLHGRRIQTVLFYELLYFAGNREQATHLKQESLFAELSKSFAS